jgi:hypothetical protein
MKSLSSKKGGKEILNSPAAELGTKSRSLLNLKF